MTTQFSHFILPPSTVIPTVLLPLIPYLSRPHARQQDVHSEESRGGTDRHEELLRNIIELLTDIYVTVRFSKCKCYSNGEKG